MPVNTPIPMQSLPTSGRAARRRARAQAIRDAARARQAVGQGVAHELVDGQHTITYRGKRYAGQTIDAAIAAARERSK